MNKIFKRGMQDCRSWKDGFRWGCSWSRYGGAYGTGQSTGRVDVGVLVMAPHGIARIVGYELTCGGNAMILKIRYQCPWWRQLFWKRTWYEEEIEGLRVFEQVWRGRLRSEWTGR